MTDRVRFGVIGLGLMGREFASAVARWIHLDAPGVTPVIVAAADPDAGRRNWFAARVLQTDAVYPDHRELLARADVDAVYCAVPHDLHEPIYRDVLAAGRHLLGEKPFGIDAVANASIAAAAAERPGLLVRCSSEFPFFPGAQRLVRAATEGRFGPIIEVRASIGHSSDLDPTKPINWKRMAEVNGAYGCLGDLGLHVLHIPLRLGWRPASVYALLSKVYATRPDAQGRPIPYTTWDNATLACRSEQGFPMVLETKRIAPGEGNTWAIEVHGEQGSARFSTKDPKCYQWMAYQPGGEQAWQSLDVGYEGVYPAVTGRIFEFGFPDAILQMVAAYCDELAHGERMVGSFRCATLEEAVQHHAILTAALRSHGTGRAEPVGP